MGGGERGQVGYPLRMKEIKEKKEKIYREEQGGEIAIT